MPSSVALGNLEAAVKRLVASGRYNSKSEVIREGIRLVEEREMKLAALDAALARGIADAEAGRVHPADELFDALRARYKKMVESRGDGLIFSAEARADLMRIGDYMRAIAPYALFARETCSEMQDPPRDAAPIPVPRRIQRRSSHGAWELSCLLSWSASKT